MAVRVVSIISQTQSQTSTRGCFSTLFRNFFILSLCDTRSPFSSLPLPISSKDKLWWQGKSAPGRKAWSEIDQLEAGEHCMNLMQQLHGLK